MTASTNLSAQLPVFPSKGNLRRGFVFTSGLLLLLLSLVVMASWLLRDTRLLEWVPGFRILFNTALCFSVLALALMATVLGDGVRQRVQTGAGAAVLAWAGVVLSQHVFGVDTGIDWPALHGWLQTGHPHPGRMAVPTCITMMLAGACLVAMHNARGPSAHYLINGLAALVVLTGALATAGQLIGLGTMFEVYLFGQMALPTAISFIITGVGLWLTANRPLFAGASDDQRIVYTGAMVLVGLVLVVGVIGLATLKRSVESALDDGLLLAAQSRSSMFVMLVDQRIRYAETIARRPNIIRLYRELQQQPGRRDHAEFLEKVAASELGNGFFSLEFRDAASIPLAAAGMPWPEDSALFNLQRPYGARVFWDSLHSFMLRLEVPVLDHGEIIGSIVTQQSLREIGELVLNVSGFGKTGELAVCGADDKLIYCAPMRLRRTAYEIPRQMWGRRLPVEYALDGQTGLVETLDYRGKQVIAAHTPVGDIGLGLVLKIDTTELFQPIRRELGYVVPYLFLLLLCGVIVMRMAVQPMAAKLRESRQQLSLALRASRRGIWELDVRREEIYLSEYWNAMLGGEAVERKMMLSGLRELYHPDDLPEFDRQFNQVLDGRRAGFDLDHRLRRADGSWVWLRSCGEVVERDNRGRALRLTGTSSDVSRRKSLQLQLQHQATHDALTGMPNRSLFYDRLEQAIARGRRNGGLMAVLYLDIDRFKSINDSLGHDTGDRLLKLFSRRLDACLRATDTAARLGGDEYAVILEGLASRADGELVADKIVCAMRPEFMVDSRSLLISTSVGIVFHDGSTRIDRDQLLKCADDALYRAKAAGRDSYRVYDSPAWSTARADAA